MTIEATNETPMGALEAGIAAAVTGDPGQDAAKKQEQADVEAWFKKLKAARKYDEKAREQYARDRRYARGDTGSEVGANIIGTYIDITEGDLIARQPDVDVLPAKSCEPPSEEVMREAAEHMVETDPAMLAEIQNAGMELARQLVLLGTDPQTSAEQGPMAEDMKRDELIETAVTDMKKRYAKRQRENKAFAETMELLVSRLWADADIKKRGRRWVRSGLTIAVGVLKASWQERSGQDPHALKAINDLQDNIKKLAAQKVEMGEAHGVTLDALMANYQRQLEAVQGKTEMVIARGFVSDVVAGEDFQVAPGYAIADHCDAPWNSHRIPMLVADAMALYGLNKETIKDATRFTSRKPEMIQNSSPMLEAGITAADADAFTEGASEDGDEWVMVEEIWDRDSNHVLTGIWGMKCWAKPAWQPPATTRFYPFFLFTTSEIDGQRHPQSLVSRSAKLVDEYYRIGNAEAEHRRRLMPFVIYNAGAMEDTEADKIAKGRTQELMAVKTTTPKADLRGMFVPMTYAALDPMLYDRNRIKFELDGLWGASEARQGAISVQKTLGEAEIAEQGTTARVNSRRDNMETALGELAHYTAELARCHITEDDAVAICGPDAYWPPYNDAEDLRQMLNVDIRAGSSGKPNTTAERQAMANGLPLYQQSIDKIGALRMSSPADIADCHVKLLRLFAERSGDRIDVETLLPKAGVAPVVPPGMPGAVPGAPGAPVDPAAPVAPVAEVTPA